MKELRDYQQSSLESSNERLEAGINRQLICLATGLGKTLVATKIMQQYPGKILFLTHREELIEQSALAILREEEFFENHHMQMIHDEDGLINLMRNKGMCFTGNYESGRELMDHIGIVKQDLFQINSRITVASVQTMVRRYKLMDPMHYDVIVIDEAHLAMSKSFTTVIEYFQTKLRLGLTATPYRLDGLSLSNLFDEIVANYDIRYGIENNWLCELDAYRIKTEITLDEVKTLGGDFNIGQLDKLIDTPIRNRKVVAAYLQYAKDRPAIMFCNTVKHAMNLADKFNEMGVSATFVVGDEKLCPNRKERISLYSSGEIKVITSVDIMTTGVDIPFTGCVGMVRPTKSKTLYLQSLGRGTRLKPEGCGYKDCVVLDIVDNTSKHSLINTETLDSGKPLEEKIFMTKLKKLALIEKRDTERKLKHIQKEDQKIRLLPLPQVSLKFTADMKKKPSEAQLKTLRDRGFDVDNDEFTMGHAFEMIANMPASDAQVHALSKWHYDVSGGVTVAQARKAFEDIEKRTQHRNVTVNHPFIGLT